MKKRLLIFLLIVTLIFSITVTCWAENSVGDAKGNFIILIQNSWKDIAVFIGVCLFKICIAAAIFFVLGFTIGIVLFLILYKRGIFNAKWKWYRYVKWLWLPVFVLSLGIAGCYAGVSVGGRKAICDAITKQHIVRKVIANLYCAAILDKMEYKLGGEESISQIIDTLETGQAIIDITIDEMEKCTRTGLNEYLESTNTKSWLRTKMVNYIMARDFNKKFFSGILCTDIPVTITMVYRSAMDNSQLQGYLKDNPEKATIAAVIVTQFQLLENKIVSEVNSIAYVNVFLCTLLGFGIPICLLVFFRICHRISN